ncbi:DNA recombination protein RmuC [Nocardia takedensis]|uniref:DNA recombination protein RmuC n=1 Tax=Nocardia takedensis TaxID=259390 RepID=UPI003F761B92
MAEQLEAMSADRSMLHASSEQMLKEIEQIKYVFRRLAARGQWGEQTLRLVVEASGMLKLIDFDDQPVFTDDDGGQRPDLVINLGGDMSVVVDAKAPFNSLIEATYARDDAERQQRLAVHVKNVRTHTDQLSAKQY